MLTSHTARTPDARTTMHTTALPSTPLRYTALAAEAAAVAVAVAVAEAAAATVAAGAVGRCNKSIGRKERGRRNFLETR